MQNNWYIKSVSDVFETVKSNKQGLSTEEAISRLKEYGQNKLPESKPDKIFVIFLRQFKSSLIYILLLACAIVFIMGEFVDGIILLIVLVFNAIIGAIQEGKAQNTLLALRKYTGAKITVLRDNKEIIILDTELVVGDIIILQEGERVPADARLILSNNLKIDEAALSGESVPVNKISEKIEREYLPIAEQKNIVFKGTHVLIGSGVAVVVATGINTVIGKIAKEVSTIDTDVPLKKDVRLLSRAIIIAVIFLNIILFTAGIYLGHSVNEMFATIVSLSVSIIPEGLPIVMTLILASGVWRMSKRNALVKRLQAVDALGQAEIIAVDKTGTITKNEMVVQKIFVDNKFFDISGEGYIPRGEVKIDSKIIEPLNHPELIFAVKNAALCASARVSFSEEENRWMVNGDPTEASLLVLAQKIGFHKNVLEEEFPIVVDFPFDYHLRYRASLRENNKNKILIVVGAPENILNISEKIWHNGKNCNFLLGEKEKIKDIFEKTSEQGLRVVALAINDDSVKNVKPQEIKKVTFVGFFGMKDALRQEVPESMRRAILAGVRVIMITGDHKITAMAVAKEAGIYKPGDEIITGEELEKITDEELASRIKNVSVFARVSPEHKLRIVRAFKIAKKIIAMTGDGVNDAPSLVAADLGVAMGKIGTEVAKEASDIILLDDNFGTIISAIEEGRNIYRDIKKVILFLFSTSLGEVLTISVAIFLGYPIPILPAHIIWLNFVTDPLLAPSLASEVSEKKSLLGIIKKSSRQLVDSLMVQRMFFMAIPMMIGTLFIFIGLFQTNLLKAQTMSLVVLAVFQWFNAYNCRSESKSFFRTNPFSNKFLVLSTIIVILLQLFAIYNPFMQKILNTTPLNGYDWLLIILVAFSIIISEEIRKLFYKFYSNKKI